MKLRHTPLSIPATGVWLDGVLAHAPDVRALALCVQATGPSTLAPSERPLELELQAAGFATMTVHLLPRLEAQRDPDASFNIPRLTERILAAMEWAAHQPPLVDLPLGLAADGTSCAAAIRAAVRAPERLSAIACLGGRADLAGAEPLRMVRTPVRLIVTPGTAEAIILERAYPLLKGAHHWLALPPASAEQEQERLAARAAATWLRQHIPQAAGTTPA
ncbi:alpha/beta hydrolase [Thauera sp. WH-1]|uniref:alpha/beta hydrolase n=1 Tax=Thauera sp. WH-1 TaxID=3398230 RepID=UPI0039FBA19F